MKVDILSAVFGGKVRDAQKEIKQFVQGAINTIRMGDSEGKAKALTIAIAYLSRTAEILKRPEMLLKDPYKDLRPAAQAFIDKWANAIEPEPAVIVLDGYKFPFTKDGGLGKVGPK